MDKNSICKDGGEMQQRMISGILLRDDIDKYSKMVDDQHKKFKNHLYESMGSDYKNSRKLVAGHALCTMGGVGDSQTIESTKASMTKDCILIDEKNPSSRGDKILYIKKSNA